MDAADSAVGLSCASLWETAIQLGASIVGVAGQSRHSKLEVTTDCYERMTRRNRSPMRPAAVVEYQALALLTPKGQHLGESR